MNGKFLFILLTASALIFQGCAGNRQRADKDAEEGNTPAIESVSIPNQSVESESIGNANPGEVYGPSLPPQNETQPVQPTPPVEQAQSEQQQPAKPKLCVVLGPGFARGIAHAGVIEALIQNQIPIGCVVGVEMGAVVGSFYALNGSVNTMEWQLFKVNKENLFNFPLLSLGAKRSSGKDFHKFLHEIIGDRTIESLRVPFAAVATRPSGAQPIVFDAGNLNDALSASVAEPGIFNSWKMQDGRRLIGGGVSAPSPVEIARKLGATFVVAVSVLPDPGETAGQSDEIFEKAFVPILNLSHLEERGADIVIKPDLRDAAYDDFSQLGALVAAGRDKANELAAEIKARWEKSQQALEAN